MKTEQAVRETIKLLEAFDLTHPSGTPAYVARQMIAVRSAQIEALKWVLAPEIGEFCKYPPEPEQELVGDYSFL